MDINKIKAIKIIIFLFIAAPISLYSQKISYSYDASGNRIKREYAILRKKSLSANEEKDTVFQSTFQVKAYPNPFSEQVTINIEMQKELNIDHTFFFSFGSTNPFSLW